MVVGSETDILEVQEAAALKLHEGKNDAARVRKVNRLQSVLGQKALLSFWRLPCFIEDGIVLKPLGCAFRENQLVLETDRSAAELFIVKDPANPGQRVRWISALQGGRIASSEFVESGGRQGSSLLYEKHVLSRRRLWLSAAFRRVHPTLAGIIERAVAVPGSKCKLAPSMAAFKRAAAKALRQNRMREALCLSTPAGMRSLKALEPFAMTADEYLAFISRIDHAGSRTGLAGT
jgi:hypothetical protein